MCHIRCYIQSLNDIRSRLVYREPTTRQYWHTTLPWPPSSELAHHPTPYSFSSCFIFKKNWAMPPYSMMCKCLNPPPHIQQRTLLQKLLMYRQLHAVTLPTLTAAVSTSSHIVTPPPDMAIDIEVPHLFERPHDLSISLTFLWWSKHSFSPHHIWTYHFKALC